MPHTSVERAACFFNRPGAANAKALGFLSAVWGFFSFLGRWGRLLCWSAMFAEARAAAMDKATGWRRRARGAACACVARSPWSGSGNAFAIPTFSALRTGARAGDRDALIDKTCGREGGAMATPSWS